MMGWVGNGCDGKVGGQNGRQECVSRPGSLLIFQKLIEMNTKPRVSDAIKFESLYFFQRLL